jgi:hypothetical protein
VEEWSKLDGGDSRSFGCVVGLDGHVCLWVCGAFSGDSNLYRLLIVMVNIGMEEYQKMIRIRNTYTIDHNISAARVQSN